MQANPPSNPQANATIHKKVSQQLIQQNKRLSLLLSETDAVYHEAAKRLGLADSVMKILYVICHIGSNCLLADIVRLSGVGKQTINSALRKLESQDILYLQSSPVGRRKIVCLTENGQRLAEETVLRLIQMENEAMLNWTEEETNVYIELTQRFLRDFKNKIQQL